MTFNKKLLAAALVTAGGFAAISSANAAESGTMQVSMTVEKGCVVTVDTNNITLTSKPDVTAPIGTGLFKVACSLETPYSVSMTPTAGSSNTGVSKGTLKSTTEGSLDTLAYQMTSDAAGNTPWEAGTLGNLDTGGIGAGTGIEGNKDFTVYAKVTENINVARPGTYIDTVTIGVNY